MHIGTSEISWIYLVSLSTDCLIYTSIVVSEEKEVLMAGDPSVPDTSV